MEEKNKTIDNTEDKMLRTWYLIIKCVVFICIIIGIYFFSHISLGTSENRIQFYQNIFWNFLITSSLITFILSLVPYFLSYLVERLLNVKYKIARKIRIIEPIIYLILSIVFTLGFMYNRF